MQSHNYVPGVSGWKIDNTGRLELNEGNVRVNAKNVMFTTSGPGQTNDQAAESIKACIAEEAVSRASSDEALATHIGAFTCNPSSKLSDIYSVKLDVNDRGQYIACGLGIGLCSGESQPDILVKAEHIEILPDGMVRIKQAALGDTPASNNASDILDALCAAISETELGRSVAEQIARADIADRVREVIHEEIRPGGLLHRN
jgi:hypothetical protein